ncbi:MAG: Ig-like domain-containing protein, partial [Saprospiraceae bacterium]|nr:Ig-like domain-containing protein [Saprospiraceae bacterium]
MKKFYNTSGIKAATIMVESKSSIKRILAVIVFTVGLLLPTISFGQVQIVTFNTPGATTWTAPAGVTTIQVETWGGGGSGANVTPPATAGRGAGGGGAYSRSIITVVPGTTYDLTVGAGSSTAAVGGTSFFINAATMSAVGGNSAADDATPGATGGAAGSGVGQFKFSGGNGADGTATFGGGAGSSAGTAAAGNPGAGSTGGTAPAGGGNGGNGRTVDNGPGVNGSAPGGGGGGALRTGSGNIAGRSTGGNGQVIIKYGCANPLSATVTSTNISCNNLNDGSIVITNPMGGAGINYEYRLNTGSWQTSGSFTALGAGSYAVQIRDADNPFCEKTLSTVSITNPAILNATVAKTNVNCFGANNGSITVSNPTGGNGTYNVSIDGANWFAVSTGSPYTFNSLAPGTYIVQIRDAAFPTCVVNLGMQTITQPAQMNAVVAKTNITCFGLNNGTITVSLPIGGGGTYQISIDNVIWQDLLTGGSFTYTMLMPGLYTVRIRDAAVPSCVVVLGTQTLFEPTALSASGIATQPTCFAGGSIDLTVNGGTLPYSYDWADISGFNNPADRFGLPAGSYAVTITDDNGCQVVLGPYVITEAVGCDGVFVCREGTSTISVPAVPGALGYTWTLPLGANPTSGTIIQTTPLVIVETDDPTIDVAWAAVAVGQYEVCVEPTNDCGPGTEQCRDIFVNEVLLDITPNDILCRGAADGSIFLQVTQGIAPFTFSWTGPGGYTANVQNPEGLLPGTYNVTVTDSEGCIKTASATIAEPGTSIAISSVTIVNEDPFGSSNGSIDITVTGGTPGYTYAWSGPGGFTAATEDISGLAGGTYFVTITDDNGCTLEQSFTVQRIGGPLEISSLTKTDILCFGEMNGTINLEVIGGSGNYTYSWEALSGGPVPAGQASNQDLTDLPTGEYQVTVNDGINPEVVQSITIFQPAAALSASAAGVNISCFGAENGSIDLSVTGGTAPYSYLWDNGSAAEDLVNLGPGTYNVEITDANGCTTTATAMITEPSELVLSGIVTNSSCNPATLGAINLSVTGGSPGYTFLWSNMDATEDVNNLSPGIYTVTVTDNNSCTATASFTVRNVCLDVTKTLFRGPANNGDGSYTLTYQLKLKNTGDISLTNVQAVDNLSATYSTFSVVSVTSVKFTINGGFDGDTDTELLGAGQTLTPGEEGFVNITITVTPGTFNNPYTNTVNASAEDANGLITSDIDTEDVTFTENPIIGVAKALTAGPSILPDGSYDLTFTFTVRNYGNVPLNNVQVTDDLDAAFEAGTYTVTALSASAGFTVNSSFDGSTDQDLLSASTPMAINEIRTIVVSLNVTPSTAGPFNNQAQASATGPGGTNTSDDSQDGLNPNPDNDGDPTNNDVPTPVVFPENPQIGLAKRLAGMPVNNNDGTYTLTYEFRVKNTGDVILYDVQVTDDLSMTFNGAPVNVLSLSSANLSVNALYDGTSDFNLLAATGNTLAVGETKIITLTISVEPGIDLGPYENSATASGISAFNTSVDDISQDGLDVDPENDGPGNNSVPTPVSFTENPVLGLAKSVGLPVNNTDGTYNVTYTIYVQNYGDVPLANVQVADNLATTFTGAVSYDVQSISASGTLTANTVADFNMTNNLLVSASSSVAYNTTQIITLVVKVTPGTKLGIYNNSATGTATSPGGIPVTDISQNGSNPAPGGGNNPGSFSQPTPVSFSENPQLSVEKTIVGPVSQSGNDFTLTYEIRVENTGDVPLNNLQVNDDLATAFANATGYIVNSTTIITQPLNTTLVLNTGFLGGLDPELLDGNESLLVGEFAIIQIQVTVTAVSGTDPGGPYKNQAVALAFSPGGNFIIDLDDVEVTFFENPEIVVTKTLENLINNGNGSYSVTFKLQLESTGDVPLFELELYDDIVTLFASLNPRDFLAEEGLSLAVNANWDGTASSNILAPGQFFDEEITDDYFVFISFTIDDPAPDPASINNVATASGEGPLAASVSDTDDAIMEIQGLGADLQLDKTVSNLTPNVGEVVTFTITVSNSGPEDATGVAVEDLVPNGYGSIANISNGGILTGSTITWSGLSITNGDNIALTFDATVLAPGMGVSYLNYAQVTASDQDDPNSTPDNDSNNEDDDDTQDITPQEADLSLDKTVSNATPNVGDVVTFTITVSNAGPDAATGVAVEVLVPNGYGSITNISNSGTLSGSTITWSGLSITASGSIQLTFDATVLAPGIGVSYLNYTQVTDSDQFDPNSTPDNDSNNEDDDDTQDITPQVADLSLDKTVSNSTPNVGDVVTFTITVSNAGPDAATGVSVEDLVPNGYGSITNISNGGTLSGSTITWSGLSITNGGNIALTFQATVLAPGMGVFYLNYAQVTDSDQYDPNSTPDNDSNNEDDDDSQDITPVVIATWVLNK